MAKKNLVVSYKQEEEPIRDMSVCTAHDCPLPAGMSHDVGGVSNWVCQCHFHSDRAHWSEITHRINQDMTHVKLIVALRKAKRINAVSWLAALAERGRDDLLPSNDAYIFDKSAISERKWLRELESYLHKRVTFGLEEVKSKTEGDSVNEAMRAAAEFVKAHKLVRRDVNF